jgi:TonB family protein
MPAPREVAASGIKGSVAVEVIVREDGRVSDARILRSVPVLDAAALAIVRTWRFAPATLNGRPVPVRLVVVVNF